MVVCRQSRTSVSSAVRRGVLPHLGIEGSSHLAHLPNYSSDMSSLFGSRTFISKAASTMATRPCWNCTGSLDQVSTRCCSAESDPTDRLLCGLAEMPLGTGGAAPCAAPWLKLSVFPVLFAIGRGFDSPRLHDVSRGIITTYTHRTRMRVHMRVLAGGMTPLLPAFVVG